MKIVWDLNTFLSIINRSSIQEINKEMLDLNYTFRLCGSYIHHIYITHMCIVIQQQQNTHYSQVHMEQSPCQILRLGKNVIEKFRTINIKPSVFSDYNGMKLEITIKRKSWKIYRHVETKQHIPENPVGQRRNQKGNSDNTEKEMKMDILHTKT